MRPTINQWRGGAVLPARMLFITLASASALAVSAQTVVQDGFESASFAPGWNVTGGVSLESGGGASGTGRFARLAPSSAGAGRELSARFDGAAPDGARDYYVEFSFRIQDSAQRQFNLQVSTVASATACINLRYQGGWAAYDGSTWQPLGGLGSIIPGQWYRARLTGLGWGLGDARFSLAVSEAGSTNFTCAATNLTWFQAGSPSANAARSFAFSTVFGNNPGFDVDEVLAAVTGSVSGPAETNAVLNISGTYPHLAVFSAEGEIGIGAVVPWAQRLWFVTYPPHMPQGSADKLWTVDSNLTLTARPESVGGTHANRLIHRESQQLIIGPHLIDSNGVVRTIAPSVMPGRLTAVARHLTDPANRVYFLTMEKGLYDVDVHSLAVTTIYRDGNISDTTYPKAPFPGTHGKGGYTAQGLLLFANDGESGWSPAKDPGFNGPAGVLTEHLGTKWQEAWNIVERKNFTEVTGPGGIYGNPTSDDPAWSLGWDKRSVLLKVLDHGAWHTFRLPKGSYTHDALHGWYTEWPRIRELHDGQYLMHMHGLFYSFPGTFAAGQTAGLRPLCTYLRMPVDYCWWNGQLVMSRDESSTTGGNKWAGQSNSALWFGRLSDLETWGAPAGFGGPWKEDAVAANSPSDPFLVSGFKQRVLHLKHATASAVKFAVEIDPDGAGAWQTWTNVTINPNGYGWCLLPATLRANWVRLASDTAATGVTAYFILGNPPVAAAPELFAGLADVNAASPGSDGIIRARTGDARTLQFAANSWDAAGDNQAGYYEMGGAFQLRRATNATAESTLRTSYSLAKADFTVDAASVVFTEGTNRFRLPKSAAAYDQPFGSGWPRGVREVITERNLFNAHGTFYELPRTDAGGFRRVRPVATHNKRISDFATWRGLLVMAGVAAGATNHGHVFRSDDGQAALWFGNEDDLWRLGPPAGVGGPWRQTSVTAHTPSDPYLMFGYQQKTLELSHSANRPVTFTVEVDVAADNTWCEYARFTVPAGQTFKHAFPEGFAAHWVRLESDADTTATGVFTYGPAVPKISGLTPRADGNFELAFDGAAGQSYTVRASHDPAEPPAQWSPLANGLFSTNPEVFADLEATNFSRRFYVISVP